jgi:exodeoxyribonuclease-3
MRLVSWNVNGLRAVFGRGDLDWALGKASDVDVVCLQETKIQPDAITFDMRTPPGWKSFWSHGKKKGYSGTAVFVRDTVTASELPFKLGNDPDGLWEPGAFDDEGRVVALDLGAFLLFNCYFPNGASGDDRLAFKAAWHDVFGKKVAALAQDKPVVVCGDLNIAHKTFDVAKPEKWQYESGFLPSERAWLDRFLASGFLDSFRALKGDIPRQFTFWETRVDARKDNLGWRIDYFFVSQDLEDKMIDAWISPQIKGSDHCPVGVELAIAAAPVEEDWSAAGDDEESDPGFRR